jgi:hypothetical protein
MNRRQTVAALRKAFCSGRARKCSASFAFDSLINSTSIRDEVVGEELGTKIRMAAYGFQWALNTGRAPTRIELSMRDMTAWDVVPFIVQIAESCETVGEVADWINEKL